MLQQKLVDETIAAAEALIAAQSKDATTFAKWSEALIRYVLYKTAQRTEAQYLDNLCAQIYYESHQDNVNNALINELTTMYLTSLNEQVADLNLNVQVVWEPIFDRAILE